MICYYYPESAWERMVLDTPSLIAVVLLCILPLLIVITMFIRGMYGDKKRAEILTKAAEYGANVDLEKMAELMSSRGGRRQRKYKDPLEMLNCRLIWGTVCLMAGLVMVVVSLIVFHDADFFVVLGSVIAAVGGGLLIVYFATRTQIIEEWRRNEHRSTEDKK